MSKFSELNELEKEVGKEAFEKVYRFFLRHGDVSWAFDRGMKIAKQSHAMGALQGDDILERQRRNKMFKDEYKICRVTIHKTLKEWFS